MIAEPFVDLGRHARTLHGMLEMSELPLTANLYGKFSTLAKYERTALGKVADAATAHPDAFGSDHNAVRAGVDRLHSAIARLGDVEALPPAVRPRQLPADADVQLAEPAGTTSKWLGLKKSPFYSAQHIGPSISLAHQDVLEAHRLLGGTRALPEFEPGPAPIAKLDVAPAHDPQVRAQGFERRQRLALRVLEPVLKLGLGVRTHGPAAPKHGPLFAAATHVAGYDSFIQATDVGRAFRPMFDSRFLYKGGDPARKTLVGRVIESLGGYGVTKGSGTGGADGMRVFNGVLQPEVGQATVVYPQGMIWPTGAPTPLAPSTVRSVLHINAGIDDPAKKIPIQTVAGYGYQSSKYLLERQSPRRIAEVVRDAPKVYDVAPTDVNLQLVMEDVARRMESVMDQAKAHYDARRIAHLAQREPSFLPRHA